jgi:hypothetical protein
MSYNLLTVSQKIDRLIAVGASKQAIELLKTQLAQEKMATKVHHEAAQDASEKRQQVALAELAAKMATIADEREKRIAAAKEVAAIAAAKKAARVKAIEQQKQKYLEWAEKELSRRQLQWAAFWEKEAAATKAAEEATKRQQESYERMLAGLTPVEKAQMKTREKEENEAENAWLGDSTRND